MALGSVLREFGVKLSLAFDKGKVEEAKKSIEAVGASMRNVGLAVSATATSLLGFADIASSNSRTLQQNSQMLGINVERLQELEYAAKVTAGTSREELMSALEGVSQTLDKARHSNVEAAQSFIRLGVPMEMIMNRSITADQVMLALSDRFKGIQDPIAKARLATDAFGGAGAKLLPLLNKGSVAIAQMGQEARQMGVVLSKDVIDKGAEFDRQFSKIWIVLKNITYLIGNELIKYMGPLVTEFQKFIIENRKFIALGIATVMKSLGQYLQIVFTTTKFLIERFVYLVHVMGGLERVAKVVGIAMGVITAVKIVSALGTLVKSFQIMGAALGIVSIEAIAIGAGLAALVFIVQDLFSKDSIIKEWISLFKEKITSAVASVAHAFAEHFPNITKFLTGIRDVALDVGDDIGEAFQTAFSWIKEGVGYLADFASWLNKVLGITDSLKSVMSALGLVGGKIGQGLEAAGGVIGSGLGAAGEYLTAHSSAGAARGAGASGTQVEQHNHFSTDVTVAVPPGTSPGAAEQMIGGGLDHGLGAMLRQTRNQALGGVAY